MRGERCRGEGGGVGRRGPRCSPPCPGVGHDTPTTPEVAASAAAGASRASEGGHTGAIRGPVSPAQGGEAHPTLDSRSNVGAAFSSWARGTGRAQRPPPHRPPPLAPTHPTPPRSRVARWRAEDSPYPDRNQRHGRIPCRSYLTSYSQSRFSAMALSLPPVRLDPIAWLLYSGPAPKARQTAGAFWRGRFERDRLVLPQPL